MSGGTLGSREDAVFITVDITPRPTPPVTIPHPATGGGSTGFPGGLDHGWLAVTGMEPAWLLGGGAVMALVIGTVLLRARRGRLSAPLPGDPPRTPSHH